MTYFSVAETVLKYWSEQEKEWEYNRLSTGWCVRGWPMSAARVIR